MDIPTIVRPEVAIKGIAWCKNDHVWRATSIPVLADRIIEPMKCTICKEECLAFVDESNEKRANTTTKRRALLRFMKRQVGERQ